MNDIDNKYENILENIDYVLKNSILLLRHLDAANLIAPNRYHTYIIYMYTSDVIAILS